MIKHTTTNKLNIKLYLLAVGLKEDKTYNLKKTENDEGLVFVLKDKGALCRFLIDKNVDITSPRISDIINHDLIMKEFEDGTIICSKQLCQYLCNKAKEKTDVIQQKSLKRKNKVKSKIANRH